MHHVSGLFVACAVLTITHLAVRANQATALNIRAVAKHRPEQLRGITVRQALAKADHLDRSRQMLRPTGWVVVAGILVWAFFL